MQQRLTDYARLIVEVGANVQAGQTVLVAASVDSACFARLIAEKAYDAGAREVVTRFYDEQLKRMHFLRADAAVFDEVARWVPEFYNEYAEKGAALISITAADPELLLGVDPDRIQRSNISTGTALKGFYDKQMSNAFPWTIAAIPSEAWAKKVFPDLPPAEAVERLWDAIFTAVHVGAGDPVVVWREKIKTMDTRAAALNAHRFQKLRYKNSLGTDLTLTLPEEHLWTACGEEAGTGQVFVANMPTEEIFVLPDKRGTEGVVCASMPLSLNGNLVEDIKLTFEGGKIVKAEASKGLEHLEKELDIDEGARYLGEIALVPYRSPISEMGILFYNTLFDENASCHLAFGKAYPKFRDMAERTEEELLVRGMNDSLVHVDFMIGTADLEITGMTEDGREVAVFRDGNFAEGFGV
ncbi:MAG: aminopeptidase [Oscillospiraceae bacterium]|nr:aminopeptidase [Oscillospiraceae bacterium]